MILEAGCEHDTRHVLLHAHMFKNAGSTFDGSLRRHFRAGFTDHRDDQAMRQGGSYLGPYLSDHPGLQALSSHWVTFPLPEMHETVIHLALFFRDPLERIVSVYRFERRQGGDAPGVKKARELNFSEYVRWRLEERVGPVIRNFHTRYCSDSYGSTDFERSYRQALATLDRTPLLGLVHRYEESMVLFEHHLRPFFPGLDLSWTLINSSDDAPLDYALKRRRAQEALGPLIDDVFAANEYDLKLYGEVESRFNRAIAAVPAFDDHLLDLQTRCGELT